VTNSVEAPHLQLTVMQSDRSLSRKPHHIDR
jgi:hypothetical protein